MIAFNADINDRGESLRNYDSAESGVVELSDQIYQDSVRESSQSFDKSGGVKDAHLISAGHGPKVRIWDYFGPAYNCASKERVGKLGDGGKWLCGVRTWLPKRSNCVVYSFGSKGEVSFELGVASKLPNCEIHIFDPTLTPEQKEMVKTIPGAVFHDFGVGTKDGNESIARRLTWIQKTKLVYPMKTLSTIMNILGHTWIDVLKMDIEGGEWKVFDNVFSSFSVVPVGQIQIELHFLGDVRPVLTFFRGMQFKKFRPFSVEPNYYGRTAENARNMIEYSFVQVGNAGRLETG
eukprot:CAMPEP_0198703288 /NCGR_PEP_ID=MMETSP1468-20131203/389259_1 /TAXON_ID=1461545 /ORGANISM="Mantoniella sp, Strain CCMP1436" /LENGTH=291 /DNA_ID=CAMNT_0044461963 /DNA_START=1160 /DNA_END=2035 /DNA_ORIENTATION=-